MKLYLLLIPLLAAAACAPSVSQDEYDGLSADFRQSQTEVSELKSQLNTAETKLTELGRSRLQGSPTGEMKWGLAR